MSEKTAICFVVHKGYLEMQGIILAASLKFYNSTDYDLFVAIPRFLGGVANGISKKTRVFLSRLGVNFFEIENQFEHDYLIGNKFGCLNKITGYKDTLFLDTDIICVGELNLPKLSEDQIAVKPADRKTYTWSDDVWRSAYREFAQTSAPENRVDSSCFNEMMYPYYNAGVIYINTEREFGREWQELSIKLDNNSFYENKRPWLDQLALPLTIQKIGLEVVLISENLNFPANIQHVIGSEVKLVHYHRPKNIARNQNLLQKIADLCSAYPELTELLSLDEDWKQVADVIESYKNHQVLFSAKVNNVLITGIPRSGTSLLSAIATQGEGNVVINEPQGFPKPLKRRAFPWGVHGLFLDIRRDIITETPIMNKHKDGKLVEDTVDDNKRREQVFPDISPDFNLIIKNTLAGMIGLDRIITTFPELLLVICFRDPVDTLASWKTSFEHLAVAKPSQIGVISEQLNWLTFDERKRLLAIDKENDAIYRRALLWQFLAKKIIRLSKHAKLVNYSDLTNNTQAEISAIQTYLGISKIEPQFTLQSRSKKHLLEQEEIDLIVKICGPTYNHLCSLAAQ